MTPPATGPLPAALYVVATPIGNMEDLTLRAARILREVDVVACEDTRTSGPLLVHVGSHAKRIAVHDHNEGHAAAGVVEMIRGGQSVALISDAGTPLLSDPGHSVVAAAVAAGLTVVPVPGPSALLAGLVGSALPAARFHFVGFLPDRASRREALLMELADLQATLVFYAPPRELPEVCASLLAVLGDRRACVARELTKLHEEFRRGLLSELVANPPVALGEAVVLVDGAPDRATDEGALDRAIRAALDAGEATSGIAKRLAKEHRMARGAVYERVLGIKGPG